MKTIYSKISFTWNKWLSNGKVVSNEHFRLATTMFLHLASLSFFVSS
jgi:hypothetical protein